MSAAIGPATDRLLVASTAIAVLVVTATFLFPATVDVTPPGPAGDELEAPPASENLSTAGPNGTEFVSTPDEGRVPPTDDGAGSTPDEQPASIAVDASSTDGWLVPGRVVNVTVVRGDDRVEDATVAVDGRTVGTTGDAAGVPVTVPASESMVLSGTLPVGEAVERELSVEHDVDVSFTSTVSRFEASNVSATIRGYSFTGADVAVAGEHAGEIGEGGIASIDVPEDATEVEVVVSEGDVVGRQTVDLDLDATIDQGLPVAASRGTVAASYEDVPADAAVYVVGGDATDRVEEVIATREPDGRTDDAAAHVYLPAASQATIVVTDGESVETVVVDDLLLNLAIAVVGALCIGVGLVVTTLRILRWLDVLGENAPRHGSFTGRTAVLQRLGGALVDGAVTTAATLATVRLPSIPQRPPLPSLSFPSLPPLGTPSLPPLTLPSLSLPSLGVPSLSLPSPGSADESVASGGSAVETPLAEADAEDAPTLSDRELVRAAVRDLGRLSGVTRVETATPGQIGRRALDAALPREPVLHIVETVRAVEYGGNEPTRDRAERAREAVRRIRDALSDGGEAE